MFCVCHTHTQRTGFEKAAKSVDEKSVEMIHVKDINKITGYIRGGCTAIGMKKEYPTVLDSSALDQTTIMVSGGKNGIQIELTPDDYLKACHGKTEQITH
nr:YbaK/EbsC family protein [Anaerostipes sp. 494a]